MYATDTTRAAALERQLDDTTALIIGILSVPFLLMWGITGAAIEVPAVEKA